MAGLRRDLRDARAHDAGADDEDGGVGAKVEIHVDACAGCGGPRSRSRGGRQLSRPRAPRREEFPIGSRSSGRYRTQARSVPTGEPRHGSDQDAARGLRPRLLGACGGGGGTSSGGTGTIGNPVVTSTVSGVVADKSGVPIAGATVSVFHHNDNTTVTTTTDANGAYSVAGLATGANSEYEIYVAKTGLAFYPALGDAAGSVEKFDFNGLYRTVIRFLAMPARDVTTAHFTASRARRPRGQPGAHRADDELSRRRRRRRAPRRGLASAALRRQRRRHRGGQAHRPGLAEERRLHRGAATGPRRSAPRTCSRAAPAA